MSATTKLATRSVVLRKVQVTGVNGEGNLKEKNRISTEI